MILLPLKVLHPYERTAYATYALIGLHVLAFVLTFDEIPRDLLLDPGDLELQQLLTSGFLHAGFMHLLGNMIFLFAYGRYVEERMGPGRFLGLYVVAELGSSLAYLAFGHGAPSLGSSGAVSGMMGFVFVGAPFASVECVFIWFVYVRKVRIAALWILGFWLAVQFVTELTLGRLSGVAVAAHLGGFATGAAVAGLLRSAVAQGTDWYLDPRESEGGGRAARRRLRRARGRRATRSGVHGVVVRALDPEASPVAVVKLLIKRLGLTPTAAKAHVDAVQAGARQTYRFDDVQAARRFADEAKELGVDAAPAGPAARTT